MNRCIIRDGFGFTAISYPFSINDTIIIKKKGKSTCESPQLNVPVKEIYEYVDFINSNSLEKALIISDEISFLLNSPSLKFLNIFPSYEATDNFDFSPLYGMKTIKYLSCHNSYGFQEKHSGQIDFNKINALEVLGLSVNKATLNFDGLKSLKSLLVSDFSGKDSDLTDLFSSPLLDTLSMVQCRIKSLNGIGISKRMQCLYLYYNKSLSDISALRSVKSTLKALRIENCPKIEDFSVLGELESLELLELTGSNNLPSLSFLQTMPNLKTFTFSMNILDGDLSLCKNLSYVYSEKNRKHYNIKDKDLPKRECVRGNESIEEWRRLE